jgi:hypothetical protein
MNLKRNEIEKILEEEKAEHTDLVQPAGVKDKPFFFVPKRHLKTKGGRKFRIRKA